MVGPHSGSRHSTTGPPTRVSIPPHALLATLGPDVLGREDVREHTVVGKASHAVPTLHALSHFEAVAPRADEPIAHVDRCPCSKVGHVGGDVHQAVGHALTSMSCPERLP